MAAPPDEPGCATLLEPLLDALEVLHDANVYHRDIAPDNVMLLAQRPAGAARLRRRAPRASATARRRSPRSSSRATRRSSNTPRCPACAGAVDRPLRARRRHALPDHRSSTHARGDARRARSAAPAAVRGRAHRHPALPAARDRRHAGGASRATACVGAGRARIAEGRRRCLAGARESDDVDRAPRRAGRRRTIPRLAGRDAHAVDAPRASRRRCGAGRCRVRRRRARCGARRPRAVGGRRTDDHFRQAGVARCCPLGGVTRRCSIRAIAAADASATRAPGSAMLVQPSTIGSKKPPEVAAETVRAPVRIRARDHPKRPTPSSAPASNTSHEAMADPRAACADRTFIGRLVCLDRVCREPAYRTHAECAAVQRSIEARRRRQEENR